MIDYIVTVRLTPKPSYFVTIFEVETKLGSNVDFDISDMGANQEEAEALIKEEIADILIERIEDRFEGKPYFETGMTVMVHAPFWSNPSIPLYEKDSDPES